jgi:PAS domain S-box-containing protein
MTYLYPYHFFFLSQSALGAFLLASFLWSRRAARGGWPLFLLMMAIGIWAAANAAEIITIAIPMKILWSKISYIGICSVAPLWFTFVIRYTDREWLLTPFRTVLFWIVPVISLGLALTNEWHGFIWPSITPSSPIPGALLIYDHGPAVWLITTWSYFFLLTGTAFLFETIIRSREFHRRQAIIIIVATLFPWAGNFLYLMNMLPFQGIDPAPFAFMITGLLFSVSIFRYNLLDLAPMAYHALFKSMENGVVVTDLQGRIQEINPAAERFLKLSSESDGKKQPEIGLILPAFLREAIDQSDSAEISLGTPESLRWLDVTVTSLQANGQPVGSLIVLTDITRRKRLENEHEETIKSLQQAISEIKTLQGFIPICCHCKKIRTDKGFWQQIEQYVSEHSEAKFSHGICPECLKKYYDVPETPPVQDAGSSGPPPA